MNQSERDRLVALKKADDGKITQRQAAEEVGLSERQVRRLLKQLRIAGDRAVIHQSRGRASNRAIDPAVEERAIAILKQDVYRGFGPTLAAEYLAKKHGIEISKETLRKWMRKQGIWRARRQRVAGIHIWRQRRERYGELVQWDTSTHEWLEGRGDGRIYLIKMIDDASSRLFARFVRHDSTEENMAVLEEYLKRFGRPLEFYTDKAAIFLTTPKKNHPGREEPLPPTQIGRALTELGIGWIAAHSPQAKGRVERSFDTAQDRLVKGLRVAEARTLEEANAYLDKEYLPEWEAKFTVTAACGDDAHRALTAQYDLNAILSHVEERVVSGDYTVRHHKQILQIAREEIRPRMRGSRVRVELRRDGQRSVRWEGRYLKTTLCEPAVSAEVQKGPYTPRPKAQRAASGSQWMKDFRTRSAPSIGKAIAISNATS